jgi:hypothetical protein
MAKVIDIYIDQGSDFTATFPPVTDNVGNIVDLTNYTVVCQIRRSYATVYAVQMTIDDSQFTEGVITITLTNGATSGLFPTRWVYDITIQDPINSIVVKVFEGLATVNPGVSSKPNTTLLTPYIPEDYGGL